MPHLLRWLFAGAVLCLVAAPAYADVTDAMREIQRAGKARVIVRMRTGGSGEQAWTTTQSAMRQRQAVSEATDNLAPKMRAARIEGIRTFRTLPFVAGTVTREQLLSLAESPDVESISVVQIERKSAIERVQISTAATSIDVANAWAAGYDGTGYTVAVIDGGFNTSHPMLAGKVVNAACFSHDFGTIQTNQCPSGKTPEISASAASNCPAGSTRCDHGTHVASIAVGNDGTNFGVARGAKLVPIDVFSKDTDATDCSPDPAPCEVTDSLAVLDALDYINDQSTALNIAAVNISIGGALKTGYCDDDVRKSVIDMLRAKGIAVAISAGNEGATGKVAVPACISSAEGVAASNDGTDIASFSNFASTLDFVAPGSSITAAAGTGTGLATRSGTSMAAPFVAGSWAVMRQALPAASFDVLENALKQTGLSTTRTGSDATLPKIQLMAAISRAQGRDRRIFNSVFSSNYRALGDSYVRFANPSTVDGVVTVTLRDVASGDSLGTWTSPNLPARSSQQFDLARIQRELANPSGLSLATAAYFNLEVASTFNGYVQHVAWNQTTGILTNLTSCAANYSSDTSFLMQVFSSKINDYTSRLRLVNTSRGTDKALLAIYDQATGAELVRWESPVVAGGGTLEIAMPNIESANSVLANRPSTTGVLFNVKVLRFNGYVQHVLESRQASALFDMTAKCDLVATAAKTTASATK